MHPFLQRLLHEPLLHFGLLAAVVFTLDEWPRRNDADAQSISVSADFVRWLSDSRTRGTGRTPSRQELEAIVDQHIEEEILVREARRLALADGDPIVRRRIAQKMRFVLEDHRVADPTDDVLQQHLESHAERYRTQSSLRLTQVFLGSEPPSASTLFAARRALTDDPNARVGHPLAMGRDLGDLTEAETARLFSKSATELLAKAPIGTWIGPIASRFGHHLVRVEDRSAARLPQLSQVRNRVQTDVRNARRSRALASEMARLRAKYTVDIEWPHAVTTDAVATAEAPR